MEKGKNISYDHLNKAINDTNTKDNVTDNTKDKAKHTQYQ